MVPPAGWRRPASRRDGVRRIEQTGQYSFLSTKYDPRMVPAPGASADGGLSTGERVQRTVKRLRAAFWRPTRTTRGDRPRQAKISVVSRRGAQPLDPIGW